MENLRRSMGALARAPTTLLSARDELELVGPLGATLRDLFPELHRFELLVRRRRELVPLVGHSATGGEPRCSSSYLTELGLLPGQADASSLTPQLLPPIRALGRGALMAAPLVDGASVLGLLCVESSLTEPDFSPNDLETLKGVAALYALALQRLAALRRIEFDSSSEAVDRRRARRIQQQLLRSDLPRSCGVDVDVRYRPAFAVGGDFYLVEDLGDGQIGAVIGDVSGKGVSAALIMSRVASDFRRSLRAREAPSDVLGDVNRALLNLDTETFATGACLRLDTASRRLTVANAGHLPLLVRRASGEVTTVDGASGTPLGVVACDYDESSAQLERSDILLFMTDGLAEALERPGDPLGHSLLRRLVAEAPHDPRAINTHVLDAIDAANEPGSLDDITVLAMHVQR